MARPTRILLIEDDQIDRMACLRAFARQPHSYEFHEADTGREGLRLARELRPDCILLDYKLPDINGLEVLTELGAIEASLPPAVMLTGANDVSVAVEAMRLGARDYLLKDTERRYLELLPPVLERALQDQKLAEEKRQAEAALAHAHRVMTAGELAAALAHELNQPLAAIASYSEACAQLLQRPAPDPKKLRDNIEQIGMQAQRAGNAIRELRAFLAKGGTEKSAIDLNVVARVAVDLIAAEARVRKVDLKLDLEERLPPVLAASVHIEHVLVNLLKNAMEAISGAGRRNGTITLSIRKSGEHLAQVTVSDTGPGFDAATADRMFEPFYTTKTEGLGMGLAISRSIVGAHGGTLWAELKSGDGATLCFTLPFAL